MSSRHDLRRQAALWSRQLEEDDGSPEMRESFLDWCRQSPRHVRAMLELGCLPDELERLRDAEDLDTAMLARRLMGNARAASAASSIHAERQHHSTIEPAHRRSSARPCAPRIGTLVKLTAVAMGIMTLGVIGKSTLPAHPHEVITVAGESRSVILRDNTHVRLGPNTRMVARLDRQQRQVEISSGDALFDVAPDPTRPFLVRTGTLTTRALGTVFAVSHYEDGSPFTSVTVASGRVEVQANAATAAPVELADSEHLLLRPGQGLRVSRVNLRDELAWVDNRLVFYQGVTLASAALQFNRRNQLQILIVDSALAARPIMGTFRASDPLAFLRHFAPLVPFDIQPAGPDQVRLVPP